MFLGNRGVKSFFFYIKYNLILVCHLVSVFRLNFICKELYITTFFLLDNGNKMFFFSHLFVITYNLLAEENHTTHLSICDWLIQASGFYLLDKIIVKPLEACFQFIPMEPTDD